MNKIISLLISVIFFSVSSYAQIAMEPSVLASGGGYVETETVSISWTLGELATTTLTGKNSILTQGFQQTFDFETNIKPEEMDWEITAYPNPVNDALYIRFDTDRTRVFWIELQDVTGRVLRLEQHKEIFPGDVIKLNTTSLTYGVYFLKALTPDRKQVQILGITKL